MTDTTHTDISKSAAHSEKDLLALNIADRDQSDKGEKDNSDGDGGERPVREKLKKTSIAALSQQAGEPIITETTDEARNEATNSSEGSHTQRGRPARKRSFEDLQQEDVQPQQEDIDNATSPNRNSAHKRMRSRDVNSAENVPNTKPQSRTEDVIQEESHQDEPSTGDTEDHNEAGLSTQMNTTQSSRTEPNGDAILSPKKKRSRDQFDKDQDTKDDASEASSEGSAMSGSDGADISDSAPKAISKTVSGEPDKKRHRDESQEAERDTHQQNTKSLSPSGFGNTSTVSPFGTFTSTKPEKERGTNSTKIEDQKETQTSSSAFQASGISAFAKSESSPFGAVGSTAKSGFGGLEASTKSGFGFGSTSGFGSSSGFGGVSSFATARPSELGGGLGNGFGGGFGSGLGAPKPLGGLSSFASPTGTGGIIGKSNAKAFGAPAEESDEDEDGGSEQSTDDPHEEKKDKRFVEHELETGEEEEDTVFSCKAKLYHFDGKEWKERAVGTFKVNVNEQEVDAPGKKARLIMRTEGVHRVALNTPIFKGMKVGGNEGQEPQGKMLNLAAMENGKAVPLLLKTGNLDMTKTLYHKIMEIQQDL
ncbi:MAG: hypothetical protein Q9160_001361 [Pyrenula sp. 1 TL-2023]